MAENASPACDPQTSGGLLVSVAPDEADLFAQAFEEATGRQPARIGEVVTAQPGSSSCARHARRRSGRSENRPGPSASPAARWSR